MTKAFALVSLVVISLLGPVLEVAITGGTELFSKFDLVGTFLSIVAIYVWYYADKRERQFRAGPLLNVGVICLAIIALPIYFIRSRGWKQGTFATAVAAVVLGGIIVLGGLGEMLGRTIAS